MTTGNIEASVVLKNLGIETLNPMQVAFGEAYAQHNNIVLLSPTGSGKTIGFLMPLLQILKSDVKGIQAIVLAPSRELALQIEDVFKKMKTGFKVNCCYGGHSVKTEINNLSEPPALLIGTPGRVDDLIKRRVLNVRNASVLIIDEFDKSLELGFQEEIKTVVQSMSFLERRILTSATQLDEFPPFLRMENPEYLDFLTNNERPNRLTIKNVSSGKGDKYDTLYKLLCDIGNESTLVFVNLRETVEDVSDFLFKQGVPNGVYHGGLEQPDRERALVKFRNGSVKVLVTTDLAARGLDIPEVKAVVHFQLPLKEEEFIHRNGRTARMHASGEAFILSDREGLPRYVNESEYPNHQFMNKLVAPALPEWETLYIGKGKKDKVNKVDIVGFLCQKGLLDKSEIGLIEVKDTFAYVAINRSKVNNVLRLIRDEKLKNFKTKIAVAN